MHWNGGADGHMICCIGGRPAIRTLRAFAVLGALAATFDDCSFCEVVEARLSDLGMQGAQLLENIGMSVSLSFPCICCQFKTNYIQH